MAEMTLGFQQPTINRKEAVKCQTCKCEWFEVVKAQKIDVNSIMSLLQAPADDTVTYSHFVTRCLRCGDIQELNINLSSGTQAVSNSYGNLVDSLKPEEEKKP